MPCDPGIIFLAQTVAQSDILLKKPSFPGFFVVVASANALCFDRIPKISVDSVDRFEKAMYNMNKL